MTGLVAVGAAVLLVASPAGANEGPAAPAAPASQPAPPANPLGLSGLEDGFSLDAVDPPADVDGSGVLGQDLPTALLPM